MRKVINLPPCVEEDYGKWRTEQSGSCKQRRALDHGLYRNVFVAGPSSMGLPPHRIASRTSAGHASSQREHYWKTSRCEQLPNAPSNFQNLPNAPPQFRRNFNSNIFPILINLKSNQHTHTQKEGQHETVAMYNVTNNAMITDQPYCRNCQLSSRI